MIDLNQEQIQALEAGKPPLELCNPRTGETFVLIERHVYDLMCGIVKPFNRNGWDDPEMDVYEQYRKKP